MLGDSNIEDYFILASIHEPPLRVTQLEAYIYAVTRLLAESFYQIQDENTRNVIRKQIISAKKVRTNLGKNFFEEAKKHLRLPPAQIIWPNEFPTIKILGATKTTVKLFQPNEVNFFLDKKKEIVNTIASLCHIHNPILLIATPTIQMERVIKSVSSDSSEFFKGVWIGNENEKKMFERTAKRVLEIGFRNYEIEVMNESYRQVVLAGIDLQRALRERLYEYCSKGEGENELISEYVFLQLFECLYTIFSIDRIENMMNEFRLPIFVLENEHTSIFLPLMSTNDSLPFQKELNDRENRLLTQYTSSKATNEEKIPQWSFFVQSLSKFEIEQLHFLIRYLEEDNRKLFIFPEAKANDIFNDKSDVPETMISEWIQGPKSPFVRVQWKGKYYYLATSIIIEDRFFRIMWKVHQGKHIRIRGTRFEDFVLDVLATQFPASLTSKNKYFYVTTSGKEKRYEIDRSFVWKNIFFPIECKNLLLTEDTANFRKLRSRINELKGYGEYLETKANLLKDNFDQLEDKIPRLRERDCSTVVPVILSAYPDMLSFHRVPFLTIYEFVRYVSAIKREGHLLSSFTDFSGTVFNFPSFEIQK